MPPTCDLATLVDRIRALKGDFPRVIIEGGPFARTALLADSLSVRIPGARISNQDGGGDAVRIWMDDPGGFHATFLRQQSEGTWAPGSWVATATADQRTAHDAQAAEERSRRERADLVFVALDGFDSVIELRFFADAGCHHALWDDHGTSGDIEALLPISDDLRRRIRQWAQEADRAWTGRTPEAGRALAAELQERLGPAYRIDYRP